LYQGKYDLALEVYVSIQPYADFSLLWQGMAYLGIGNTARARESFDAVMAIAATSTARWMAEAHLAYMSREFERGLAAVRALERMFASAGEGGEALYHFGRLYVALGDSISGFALLVRAIDNGFFPYTYFCTDPFLDGVRGQALFEDAIARAAVRHETFKKKRFDGLAISSASTPTPISVPSAT